MASGRFNPSMKNARAFTLIELLVVIAMTNKREMVLPCLS
jgi:competence protein ComGC